MSAATNQISSVFAEGSIIAEFILQRIDDHFEAHHYFNEGLSYIRYIDDYQCYAKTKEQAEDFVLQLRMMLSEYVLSLNTKKTKIYELPDASENAWISEIQAALPRQGKIKFVEAKRFIDYMLVLADKYPSKSVLKYGIKCILKKSSGWYDSEDTFSKVLGYALNLTFHYPSLISVISVAFHSENIQLWRRHQSKLAKILDEAVKNHRSDVMCWILYMTCLFEHTISEDTAKKIVQTGDCLSILLLYQSGQHIDMVVNYATEYILKYKNSKPAYDLDKQWLLLYQLFLENKIDNPYTVENDAGANKTFEILKEKGVCFLKVDASRGVENVQQLAA